jgi:hypothetical protein
MGNDVENVQIPFIFNTSGSMGQPKHIKTELPRTSPNILAREDIIVLQQLTVKLRAMASECSSTFLWGRISQSVGKANFPLWRSAVALTIKEIENAKPKDKNTN